MNDAAGKTVLVTGATNGLGRHVARELTAEGATVLVHGRNQERLKSVLDDLRGQEGENVARSYVADLSSLEAVRELAERILSDEGRLDVLVNNAGVISGERRVSEDGVELTFAVNYLSHFLLTRLLTPLLGDASPARVVNVASAGQSPIDFSDPMLERGYDAMRAYSQSKLAQISFTFELAGRESDSGVTVNALHPASLMDTRMVRESFGYTMSTVEEGAEAVIRLAVSPEVDGITGAYFDGKSEARADRQAYDPRARERLWTLSEQLCGRFLEPVESR
jgi:NAD(P)-dependent dehydrogenase (short-subunit alcohol dehydrogenase family)